MLSIVIDDQRSARPQASNRCALPCDARAASGRALVRALALPSRCSPHDLHMNHGDATDAHA